MEKKIGRGRCLNLITEDLIAEIISRLPAKDLMRFTCVSKSWCSLICSDPYFYRLQIERNPAISSPFLLGEKAVRCASGSYTWSHSNYLVDLDSSANLIKLHNPFPDHEDVRVVGSCRGLVVLQHQPSLKLAVSNPITRKHRPVPPNPSGDANVNVCGFGYDRVHDCYKLVTRPKRQRHLELELMIYDLNSHQWYQYKDSRPGFQCSRSLCVGGAVYWCLDQMTEFGKREIKKMLCFLLAEEEFHEVETPAFGEVKYFPNPTVLDGRMGMVMEGLDGAMHEVWVMDMKCDSNKTYSWRWTKILSLIYPKAMLPPPYYLQKNLFMIPKCFSACKTKVLYDVEQRDLFWYDMVNKGFHKLSDAPLTGHCRHFISFVPSLVGNGIL